QPPVVPCTLVSHRTPPYVPVSPTSEPPTAPPDGSQWTSGGGEAGVKLGRAGHEPDLPTSVALVHPGPHSGAGRYVRRDVTDDGQPQPVVDQLLHDLPGDSAAEGEELRIEPGDRDHDEIGPLGQSHRDQLDRARLVGQPGPVGRTVQD